MRAKIILLIAPVLLLAIHSFWSEPAFWRMGILNPVEWTAKWIGAT